jgi:hypothetical protein
MPRLHKCFDKIMKKTIKKLSKNQTGAIAVLISVLIMSAILTVTLAASAIIQNGIIMGKTQVHSTKAYFAAEAGLERLLYDIRKNSFSGCSVDQHVIIGSPSTCSAGSPSPLASLSNQTTFDIQYKTPKPSLCPSVCSVSFYSFGSFSGVRRAVEVAY